MSESTRRSAGKNLLLVLATCLVTLVVLELVLWLSGYNQPLLYVYDQHTGSALRPNVAGWAKTETTEFVRNDKHGIRIHDNPRGGPKITTKKPPDVFRIAVLGDSYTESHHVAYIESFPYLMEQKLNTCKAIGRRVEVLNFAVSGYSNVQELQSFRHRAKAFDPDLVLLVFHANNDLKGNYRKLELNPFIPYAGFKGGKLVLDLSFQRDPAFQRKLSWSNRRNELINKSRVLQLAANAYGAWKNWRDRNRPRGDGPTVEQIAAETPQPNEASKLPIPGLPSNNDSAGIDKFFSVDYRPPHINTPGEHLRPKDDFQEALWKLASAIILRLRDDVVETGASFWLTATATGVSIAPDENERIEFLKQTGLSTTNYASDRLAALANRNGFRFVALAPALRSIAVRDKVDFEGFAENLDVPGHWNRNGHRVVANTLTDDICHRYSAKQ